MLTRSVAGLLVPGCARMDGRVPGSDLGGGWERAGEAPASGVGGARFPPVGWGGGAFQAAAGGGDLRRGALAKAACAPRGQDARRRRRPGCAPSGARGTARSARCGPRPADGGGSGRGGAVWLRGAGNCATGPRRAAAGGRRVPAGGMPSGVEFKRGAVCGPSGRTARKAAEAGVRPFRGAGNCATGPRWAAVGGRRGFPAEGVPSGSGARGTARPARDGPRPADGGYRQAGCRLAQGRGEPRRWQTEARQWGQIGGFVTK